MKWASTLLLTAAACAPAAASEAWFDQLEEKLTFSALGDTLRTRVGGLLSLEGYRVEQPPPGLIFTDGHALFNPRLALFLDGQLGDRVLGFVQARVDRGFDPGHNPLRVRLDEYSVRAILGAERRCNVQLGQFATVVGNWVARHDAWDNPFVTAPLPYEHLTTINDSKAPATPAELMTLEADERYEYNPILWGPSYASGAAFTARQGRFDLAVEVKNSGPASRPEAWPISRLGFGRPAYAARLGYRPDLRWNIGFSASDSVFYLPGASSSLPAGTGRHDFRQRLLAHDVGFAWHHLQVWAEIFHSRFEVPRIGPVQTVSAYLEGKYKFTPRTYGALRFNRQEFSRIADGSGGRAGWGSDLWRIDAAAGWRFTAHVELKSQVSLQRETSGTRLRQVNLATQLNVRF